MLNKFVTAVVVLLMSMTTVYAEEKEAEVKPSEQQAAVMEPTVPTSKPSTNPDHGKRIGDWVKECEVIVESPEKEVEICQLTQTLVDPESKQAMMKVAIGFVPNKEQAVMVVSLPLGVFIPPGVQMRVDDKGQVGRIPVNTCLPAGCQAGAELDQAFTDRLKKGSKLNITFANPAGQAVTAEVSLKGMTAGLNSFKK